jgi:chitodextrinase
VTGSSSSQLTVSWKPSTDDVAVVSYGAYRDGTSVGPTSSAGFTFGGLACGTTYSLAVDAVDAAGNRSAKASVSGVTSPCPDTSAPTTPSLLATSNVSGTAATLTWIASVDNVGVTGYGIYLGGAHVTDSTANLAAYTFAGFTCGTRYVFGVDAFDAAGNRSSLATLTASTSACPDTTPPNAPTGLTTSSVTTTGLTVGWTAATDNAGVVAYAVYVNGAALGTTTSTSYAISGLTCGTAYTVAVEARDAAGNTSPRLSRSVSTAACPDTTAPAAPTNLSSSGVSTTGLTLGWSASSDNVGVSTYVVYKNGSQLGQTASTSYPISGLTCGTTYTFAVEARDAAGNASSRPSVDASTPACPATTPTLATLSFASPTASTISGSVVWEVTSPVAVTRIEYRIDGGPTLWTETVAPFMFNADPDGRLDTTTLSNGSHTLTVDGYAAGGTKVAAGAKTVTVSNSSAAPPPPPPPPAATPPPPPASPGQASVYVSTTGSDSTCTRGNQSKPCASFNRAFAVAQAGDSVLVACGTYGPQQLSGTAKSSAVSFYAETFTQPSSVAEVVTATTCVTVASLDITTSRVHVIGIQATNGDVMQDHAIEELGANGALSDVVIDGWHGHQAAMYATGITMQYSKLGDTNFCGAGYNNDEDALRFWMGNAPSNNDQLLHSVVRNWIGPPDGQCGKGNGHNDCFQTPGGDNMTFDGNLFYNCPTSNLQVGEFSGGVIGSLTIRNNYFGPTEGSNSLSIGQGHCGGIVIENNVLAYPKNGMPTNNNGCSGTMTQSRNIYVGSIANCGPSTFNGSYNIFAVSGGTTCGTNAKRCAPTWAFGTPPSNGAAWLPDLSASDTCAKNSVPLTAGAYPAADIYSNSRPAGSAVDAGAYEAGP